VQLRDFVLDCIKETIHREKIQGPIPSYSFTSEQLAKILNPVKCFRNKKYYVKNTYVFHKCYSKVKIFLEKGKVI
jgi:hypothetical protein